MFNQILELENLILYILTAEVFLLFTAQLRTNVLLKKMLRLRAKRKETVEQMKEEVKNGKSEIPVVKFEKQKPEAEKKKEKSSGMDPKEVAVLQEMIAEFFG